MKLEVYDEAAPITNEQWDFLARAVRSGSLPGTFAAFPVTRAGAMDLSGTIVTPEALRDAVAADPGRYFLGSNGTVLWSRIKPEELHETPPA